MSLCLPGLKQLEAAIRARDLSTLKRSLRTNPALARSPRLVLGAAQQAFLPGLVLLVRNGADLNASYRNYRPLHALIQERPHAFSGEPSRERVKCLQWMLRHGADPEQLGAWPEMRTILVAAFSGERTYVDVLRKGGAKLDGFVAAALGDLRGVEQALRRDKGFAQARDSGNLTALHCCAGSRLGGGKASVAKSLLKIARLLLRRGVDPNARVRSWGHDVDVAYFAISSSQYDSLGELIEHGADPNAALPSAAWQTDMKYAEFLLARGADVNRAVDSGKPLLNNMIRWGQFKQAMWLLERGASPNIPDERGWTAVHQAASRGNERMLRAVLDAGGDRKRKDKSGRVPLDIARACRRAKLVALLTD